MLYKELADKDYLHGRYIDEDWTLQRIADEVGCHKTSVCRALKRYGIKRRTRTSKYPKLNDKAWLVNAYVVEKRSMYDIADEVGSTAGNIRDHLRVQGVKLRSVKEGILLAEPDGRHGKNAHHWGGGRVKLESGYVYQYAPEHPNATKLGYVMQHRLIAEGVLGRFLDSKEVVHHIDGDKRNNDPSNLEVLTRGDHVKRHFEAVRQVSLLKKENEQLKKRIAELEQNNE